ncbi:MAG TPA: hypothetical protein VF747_03050 [Blastocatellia bacterium]|jgi:hypothetical protein
MKKNLFTLFLVAIVSISLSAQAFSSNVQRHDTDDRDYSERDEINQTYELSPGAHVEVRGINGTVDIETSSGSTAEVHVVRSARSREELNYRKIIVEHTANSLVIRSEKENERGDHNVRQRVTLRVPRQVDLNVSGVNGRTNVGEVDGPVRLSGINGAVEVGQAVGHSDISGINGRVRINIARLSERGIQVSGVNGGVELRFAEDLNADLDVSGINGSVNTDVANVTVIGKFSRQNFRAKIGAGGTPITVRGVNGSVRLARIGSAG